jgi:hypothetical protein
MVMVLPEIDLTAPTTLVFWGAAGCEVPDCCAAQLRGAIARQIIRMKMDITAVRRDVEISRISNQLLRNHIATPVFVKKT